MITVECWSWINGIRVCDKSQHLSYADLEPELMLNTLAGTLVGYKVYNCSMAEFDDMTELERSQIVIKQKFDRAAYRGDPQ